MRKNIVILAIMSFMPIFAVAQDDMYIYKQKDVDKYNKSIKEYSAYYSGIDKSNEDYNRHGKLRKTFNVIGQDSLGNDIIQYIRNGRTGRSVVVDTLYGDYMRNFNYDNDDFAYSRRMSRFDDYYGSYYDPWLDIDYYDPFYYNVRWRYNSPFCRGWYDPWYNTYYTRWYNSPYIYDGWYDPYYGYYRWGGVYPYYGYGSGYYYGIPYYSGFYTYKGHTGTANHWGGRRSYNQTIRNYDNSNVRTFSNGQRSFGDRYRTFNENFGGNRGNFESSRPNYSFPSSQPQSGMFNGGSFGGSGNGSFNRGNNFGGHR